MKKLILVLSIFSLWACETRPMDEAGNLVPATADEDALLPSLSINGTTLHLETMGDIRNPMLVFLHGGPGGDYRAFISEYGGENASAYPWERKNRDAGLSALQDDYFLIFYDQRSAGLSQRHDLNSMDDYIQDLDAIVDHFIKEKQIQTGIQDTNVSLFAWSFGGILATAYINQFPDKINQIALYEPGPFTVEVWDYFKNNTTSIFAQIGREWLEDYLISKDHFSPGSHERADFQLMMNVFRAQPEFHEDPNTPMWRFGAMLADDNLDFSASDNFDISSKLNRFKGQSLFIAGSLSQGDLPQYMDMQRAVYPSSQFLVIEGTGHTGPWEKSSQIVEHLRNFYQY